jgi:glycosyltransferase involved in cell wall biosynthesis
MNTAGATPSAKPLVSVCLSAYNHEDFLGEAIDSVLAQDYPNIEIIAIDDASTDASARILESYAQNHPARIKAILLKKNVGPSIACNKAFARARGDFIALLGTDDRMRPHRISRQVEFLLNHPKHLGVFSNVAIIDGKGASMASPNPVEALFNQKVGNLRQRLIQGNFLNAPSALLRRRELLQAGGYSPLLRYVQDFDLWAKLLRHGELSKLEEVLTEYRVHSNNLSLFKSPEPVADPRCETVSVIVDMVENFPLQSLVDFPIKTKKNEVSATLKIIESLIKLDIAFFGQAWLATALAYKMLIKASPLDPELFQPLKTTIESMLKKA